MANFFTLALDTTGPEINIIAPSYTIPGEFTEIFVVVNEPLLIWQEVYFIDSAGQRYDLIFDYQASRERLYGVVDFNFCALGIGILYARVKDDVGNPSALVWKAINIMAAALAYVTIEDTDRLVTGQQVDRTVDLLEAFTAPRMEDIGIMPHTADDSLKVIITDEMEG